MKWRRLTLRVDASEAGAAEALLSTATGLQTAVVQDLRDTGQRRSNGRFSRPAALVSVYVPGSRARKTHAAFRTALQRARREGLLRSARASSATVRDADWATAWKRFYRPLRVAGKLYVVPSWRMDFHAPRGARIIMLDPGMAFGTGQHATTKMALQLLLDRVRAGEPMLDIGCGSGILSVAAAQCGAKVYASDVDPIAVKATRANLRSNGVRAAAVTCAVDVPLAFPRSPLIVANITAGTLTALAPSLARRLRAGGALVTSGVTERGRSAVLRAFRDAGLARREERSSGEWLAFVHVRARTNARRSGDA